MFLMCQLGFQFWVLAELRWKNGDIHEEVDGDEEEATKNKKKKKPSPSKPKKKAAPKAAKKNELPAKCKQYGSYAAGDYSAQRKKYIAENMEWYECSYREASSWWNESWEREELLKDMPHKEKVRRRFV